MTWSGWFFGGLAVLWAGVSAAAAIVVVVLVAAIVLRALAGRPK